MTALLEKSVYTFVYKAYYQRKQDLGRIVKDMKNFYCERYSVEMLDYAVDVYKSFLEKSAGNNDNYTK